MKAMASDIICYLVPHYNYLLQDENLTSSIVCCVCTRWLTIAQALGGMTFVLTPP